MKNWIYKERYLLRIIEHPEEMHTLEELQRIVWPGNETEIVPAHLLITIAHNGGVVIGAYLVKNAQSNVTESSAEIVEGTYHEGHLIGFVYGFPGFYQTPDGPRLKHCSHQMGVHPEHRNQGLGFVLKRAQWQMVRHQEIDRITWTYDPLLSNNGYLNISKLGAVCNTYMRDVYGKLRDGLNVGLATDRFQVDWWTNSTRVNKRLSRNARRKLDLAHYLSSGAEVVNPTSKDQKGLPRADFDQINKMTEDIVSQSREPSMILIEIPTEFLSLKSKDIDLASEWRMLTRGLFEFYFNNGYFVTDFIHLGGKNPHSYYVLSFGNSTL